MVAVAPQQDHGLRSQCIHDMVDTKRERWAEMKPDGERYLQSCWEDGREQATERCTKRMRCRNQLRTKWKDARTHKALKLEKGKREMDRGG